MLFSSGDRTTRLLKKWRSSLTRSVLCFSIKFFFFFQVNYPTKGWQQWIGIHYWKPTESKVMKGSLGEEVVPRIMGAIVSLLPFHLYHPIVCLIPQEIWAQMDTVFKELLNRQGVQEPPSSSSSSSSVPAASSPSAQSQSRKKKVWGQSGAWGGF